MTPKREFKVSVRLMAFNHERFIEQAMLGIMMQKTNFLLEVVVGDDFSTDGTLSKIKNFSDTENIKIKILDRKVGGSYWKKRQELGRLYNFTNILENCSGSYIALLDGDDYWTDPLKLQKQVDFLENNLKYSACFTNANVINENSKERDFISHTEDCSYSIREVIKNGGGMFPTASLLFRNLQEYPAFMFNFKSGDSALSLLIALKGDFYLLNEITCVYRSHGNGVFSSIKNNKKERIKINGNDILLLEAFNKYTNFQYNDTIKDTISTISLKSLLRDRYGLLRFNRLFFYKKLKFKDWRKFVNKVFSLN